jgi:mRNA interferase MazF
MYRKDFETWNSKKKILNFEHKRPFFHEKEVWYANLGVNVGFEEDGKGRDFLRPVLIYRKFSKEVLWAFPLTRTSKTSKYYFGFKGGSTSQESFAILSQIRLIDAKRLNHKIFNITEEDFIVLNKKFKALLP